MSVLRNNKRGDTIVEVILAISIFSLTVVGGLAVMNQGSATAQRSLEINQVRQSMNAQAETLRFLNASYIAEYKGVGANYSGLAGEWNKISKQIDNNTIVTSFDLKDGACPDLPANSFILNTSNATFVKLDSIKFSPAEVFARTIDGTSEGLWIEKKNGDGYLDFYIRACWEDPGNSVSIKLDTVVRLYEPRN